MTTLYRCRDAFDLEACFRERVAALARSRASWCAPLTIVAPTARLLAFLKRVAAEELGAAAGLRFLVHRSVAELILQNTTGAPRLAGPIVMERLASLAAEGSAALHERLLAFDGAGGSLHSTFRDLRDAGVPPSPLPLSGLSSEVFHAYCRFAGILRARGVVDTARFYELACAQLEWAAPALGTVLHVGAYDLTGTVARFVESMARLCPTEILAVGAGPEPAAQWGRRHLPGLAGIRQIDYITNPPRGALSSSLPALFGEVGATPARAGALEWVEAPGPAAELEDAARRVFLWHAEGVALEDLCIAARTLEPYAAHLERIFDKYSIPWTSSATRPAIALPRVRAALDALQCVVGDFPWRPFAAVLRSGILRQFGAPVDAELAAAAIRKYHISGVEFWSSPGGIDGGPDGERRRATLAALERTAEVVRAMVASAEPFLRATRRRDASAAASEWMQRELPLLDFASRECIERELAAMAELDDAGFEYEGPAHFYAELLQAMQRVRLPLRRADAGGLRVLDMQQMRGIPFRRIILLGFHEGSIPRTILEDSLLSDDARRAVASATGCDVPVKSEAAKEEQWLFSLVLGSASEKVVISRQCLDGRDRARNESPFARPLRRAATGHDGVSPAAVDRIPAHPAERCVHAMERRGVLAPRDAIIAASLLGGSPLHTADALRRATPQFVAGIRFRESVDAFVASGPEGLAFDGFAGGAPRSRIGPTALERLARCPLQYFFVHELDVEPLEEFDASDPDTARDVGMFVHDTLADLYQSVFVTNGLREAGAALAEARRRLPEVANRHFRRRLGMLARECRPWARVLEARWVRALDAFLQRDIPRLAGGGMASIETEKTFEFALRAGSESLDIRGRFDRIVTHADGSTVVGDYKTSLDLKPLVSPAATRRAQQLQLALYCIATAGRSEALGVRSPLDGSPPPETQYWDPEKLKGVRTQLYHSLESLSRMLRLGMFPLAAQEDACRRCDYRMACRSNHGPTRTRHRAAVEYHDYYSIFDDAGAGGEGT
jgi:hypothetical protein